ncbi:hypothetical protein FRC02_012095 [Tulasnella sp. 418]|nr:hypothetical protein FRC02_012095 [Tulasnella sp. 418]
MSTLNSYAPPTKLLQVPTIHPRPLDPLEPLPSSYTLPKTSKEATSCDFTLSYVRTTHIIPAAYPRMTSLLLEKDHAAAPPNESKEERKRRINVLAEKFLRKRVAIAKGTGKNELADQSPVLFNSVHRYARKDSESVDPNGVTLILAHANGFNKEVWEPTLCTILDVTSVPINEIWSFEAVNHGESARLNSGKLGDIFAWADNARDMLNLLLNYIPSEISCGTSLPTFLDKVSRDEAEQRRKRGFERRNMVGVGHSLGGCTVARAAIEVPLLWDSLVLVDPVIIPGLPIDPSGGTGTLVAGSLSRRDQWESKEEALKTFQSNPFFQAWDPRVLDIYVQDGLYEHEDGTVRLKTSRLQEAAVFAERTLPFETWELLDRLDERIILHWIMAGKVNGTGPTGNAEITQHNVWRRPRNSSNIRIPEAGHLIVHEAPKTLGEEIASFLKSHHSAGSKQALLQSRL